MTEEILHDSQVIMFCNTQNKIARTCSFRLRPTFRVTVSINSSAEKLDRNLTPKTEKGFAFSTTVFHVRFPLWLQQCPDAEVPKYHKKDYFLGISSQQETLTLSWESLFFWGFMLSYADSRALLSLGNVWVRHETKSLEICPSLILELSDLSKKPGVQKQFRKKNKIIQPLSLKAPSACIRQAIFSSKYWTSIYLKLSKLSTSCSPKEHIT